MSSFEQESLDYLANSEHLDETIKVVNVKGWVALFVFLGMVAFILAWSLIGKVPVTVSGKALISAAEGKVNVASTVSGIVKEIQVGVGQAVTEGQVLILLDTNAKSRRSEGDPGVITAPVQGVVSSIFVHVGDHVSSGTTLVDMQKKAAADTIRILGFVPLYAAQQIKPRMKARIGFNSISTRKYGMLKGTVVRVLNYPADLDSYHLQKIPSDSLKEYLVEGSTPTKIVIIDPVLNPKDPTGLAWTKSSGPSDDLLTGEVGDVQIEVDYVRPIRYIFPAKSMKE